MTDIVAGDNVTILRKDIKLLEGRRKPWKGMVTKVDGEYVYVRPTWCRWEIELYRCEVELFTSKKRQKYHRCV